MIHSRLNVPFRQHSIGSLREIMSLGSMRGFYFEVKKVSQGWWRSITPIPDFPGLSMLCHRTLGVFFHAMQVWISAMQIAALWAFMSSQWTDRTQVFMPSSQICTAWFVFGFERLTTCCNFVVANASDYTTRTHVKLSSQWQCANLRKAKFDLQACHIQAVILLNQ